MRRRRSDLDELDREVVACTRCDRLREWCERVAREKRAAFRDQAYWGKPVTSFGAANPRILIVGLAPGAHGANRTGRPFTGDGAGPFLYGALHRAGLATRAESLARDDGLELVGARIANCVRCAPPGNRPTPEEASACRPFLVRELRACADARVVLALGGFAWHELLTAYAELGAPIAKPWPRFGHGVDVELGKGFPRLVGSYHPSQQNTRTGRLTAAMFDAVLELARSRASRSVRTR